MSVVTAAPQLQFLVPWRRGGGNTPPAPPVVDEQPPPNPKHQMWRGPCDGASVTERKQYELLVPLGVNASGADSASIVIALYRYQEKCPNGRWGYVYVRTLTRELAR